MKIVTGYTGTPHVSSNDDQGFHQGIFGPGNNVLNVGSTFEAELVDATTVTIADGEGMLQGVHFRVAPGTVDTVNIDAGVVGYNRIDLICARYTKDANSGIESVDWHVVKGTPSASTPTAPDAEDGDVLAGDLVADFPMYKVTITGVTPAITTLFSIYKKSKSQSIAIQLSSGSGSVEKSFEPGIYAVSAKASASPGPVQSGSQQIYDIYALPDDYAYDNYSRLCVEDSTGLSNIYLNGVIVVEKQSPHITFYAHVGGSSATYANFEVNITRIM